MSSNSHSGQPALLLDVGQPPESVREELERILESPDFKATTRRKKLLSYLVEEMLAGRNQRLKGYTIATDVFGRDEAFDPQADPIVRLEARRLRHDLDSYYVAAGRSNPLRISIPKGQYVPSIEWLEVDLPPTRPDAGATEVASEIPDHLAPQNERSRSSAGLAVAAGVAVVVLLAAAVAYLMIMARADEPGGSDNAKGPALAILPFQADTGNERNALLGAGIAEKLTTDISRFPDLRLYAAPIAAGNLQPRDPVEMGQRLSLSYVVDGRIEAGKENGFLRISAKLLEVQTRRILWIGSYDRRDTASSLLAVQDEIAASVASALGQPYGIIRSDENGKLAAGTTPSISSYECVLRAYSYRRSLTLTAYRPARECLEQAIKRDPNYAEAWALLGWLQMDAGRFGWSEDGDANGAYQQGLATALHAEALDRENVTALKALGSIYHYLGKFSESERVQRQALRLNSNDPDTLAQLGWRLAVRGRFAEGIPYLQQAIQRTISPPGWYYHLIAVDDYMQGRYDEMLATARNSTVDGSGMSWSFVAIAEGALGNDEAAHDALRKMAAISPLLGRDPAAAYRRHQAADPIVEALVAGLRKAGWTEPVDARNLPN